jgi:hypothetical protein
MFLIWSSKNFMFFDDQKSKIAVTARKSFDVEPYVKMKKIFFRINQKFYWTQRYMNNPLLRRVWRYLRGNQNPYIEDEQTTQWPKEKVQKDKQRSTKHIYKTYKTKDRVSRTPLKTGGELRWTRVNRKSKMADTIGQSYHRIHWGKHFEIIHIWNYWTIWHQT